MTKWKLAASTAVATTVAVVTTGSIAFAEGGWGGRHYGERGHHRWMFAGWIVVLVVLVALGVALIVRLLGRTDRPAISTAGAAPASVPAPVSATAHAQAILAERLARGEISPDDYRALRDALREEGGPPPAN